MGVDIGSLTPQVFEEFLEDHATELAPLLSFEQWADVRNVTSRKGKIPRWLTPMDLPSDQHRTSKVAPGASTPRRNADFGYIDYECFDFKDGLDIEESLEAELETYTDVSNKLTRNTVLKVLADFVRGEIADMLLGNGTSGEERDLTEKSVSNAWDTANGTPLDDIDDVVKDLRGGDLQAIVGYDVALTLSKDPDITGSAAGSGREFVDFSGVRSFLQARGISQVIIDGTIEQTTEPHFTRSYGGVYDGVFYVGTRGNIVIPRLKALEQMVWTDMDRDVEVYKAKHSHGAVRSYAEHGYYFSGILS
jgi:hypothetical protein